MITDLKFSDNAVTAANPLPVTTPAGATTPAKAEDVPHVSGDVGIPALAVRRDTAAAGSGTDGDYSTLNVDANGRLYTNAITQGVTSGTPLNISDQTAVVTVSVTLTVGATYASGDFVGTSTTPISFANAVRTSGGSATIRSVTISDPAASTAAALELWLFNATVTVPADSAAWNLSDADGLKCVGVISIPTTAQFLSSATGVMHVGNLGLQFHCAATTLFGALVTRGSPTYTGTLQVILEIEYDQ